MNTRLGSTQSLRERQHSRAREDLTLAALDVVRAEGVEKASVERIATAAGTSRGTVYVHFPGGREELLHAAYLRLGEQLVTEAEKAITGVEEWRDRLAGYATAAFELSQDTHYGFFINMFGPSLMRSAEGTYAAGNLENALNREMQAAQKAGEILSDVNTAAAAALLAGALREAGAAASTSAHGSDELVRSFRQLVSGLAAR